MPRSRSRERRRSRDRKSRSKDKRSKSRDRRSRSKDKFSRSRDYKRKDRSHSRERYHKRDRQEISRRDRSGERKHSSRHRDRSGDRPKKRDISREHRRERSVSRSKKHRKSSSSDRNVKHPRPSSSHSGSQSHTKLDAIQIPNDDSTSSTDTSPTKPFDPRKTFEISNEFSREGFEQFTRDHGIDFTNIETEEDRVAVHEKMEDLLKAHFAAQGKIYPPPKVERPAINAATGFANDGSFMEQFKRMQDEYKAQLEAEKKRRAAEERLKSLPIRRRGGGKILKTGVVAKTKLNEDGSEVPAADAWSLYLKEVQKYKNSSCDSDSKTRPLVK